MIVVHDSAADAGRRARGRAALQRAARSQLVGGTAGTLVLNSVTIGLNFVLVAVLSRTLGATGYGAYAFAIAWASLLAVPAALGITPLVIRHVAAYRARESWGLLRGILRQTNRLLGASSIAFVAGGALGGRLLLGSRPEFLHPYLVALALIPLIALTGVRQAALQGLSRVLAARLPETVIAPTLTLAAVGLAAVLAADRLTATTAVALQAGGMLAAFALGAWMLRRRLPREARTATPESDLASWARSGLPLLLTSGMLAANAQLGTIVVGAISGAAEAGVYGVASRVGLFAGFVMLAATYPLMPAVAHVHATGSRAGMQRLVTTTGRAVAAASVLLAVPLVVLAGPTVAFFGSDFTGGSTALRVIVLGEAFKTLLGFGGLALVMTGYESRLAVAIAAGTATNVAVTLALVPSFGADGAAAGTAASSVVTSVLAAVLAWRVLRIYAPVVGLRRAGAA